MSSRGWRSLQATTIVGAVRRALRRAEVDGGGAPGGAAGRAPGPGVRDAVVGEPSTSDGAARGARGPDLAATGERGTGRAPRDAGPEAAAAIADRARWAGLGEPAAAALAERWPTLPDDVRQQVAAPFAVPSGAVVRWGAAGGPEPGGGRAAVATQTDGTTCGSAVLAMLAAAGDPALALWLATGEELPGYEPPELVTHRRLRPGGLDATPQRRFAAVQRAVQHVTNRLGLLGWPEALGTPPWGAVRATRFGPVRFHGELVDDTDLARTAAQLDRAVAALRAGIPVPLYVQGDLGGGLAHTVPRHVVLLTAVAEPAGTAGSTGPEEDVLRVYEPSRGVVVDLPRRALLAPQGPRVELGGWTHPAWLLLPRAAGTSG